MDSVKKMNRTTLVMPRKKKMAKIRRVAVPEEHRAKLLLWCARHCCFCAKECTTNIVIHHIDGNPSNNDLGNLIPLCFDCHGELEHYNDEHPVGTKYKYLEIKKRREQVYELYTLQYLRKVQIRISKYESLGSERTLGDTSCTVKSLSDDIPVRLRLRIEAYKGRKKLNVDLGPLYSGIALWNLNPSHTTFAHFELPISKEAKPFLYRVEVFWSIIDILDREHQMLPFSYVWTDPNSDWWFDPRVTHNESGRYQKRGRKNEVTNKHTKKGR